MSGGLATRPLAVRIRAALAEDAAVLSVFAGTLFMSALLLFSVQPVFAKMVLPRLGGSPSVWAVSMCFFQAVLLAGYCYAHALNRYAPLRWAAAGHLAVLAIAFLALPFGVAADAEPPAGDAYLWLVGVLALGVGLPFFAVSANAPLLQAWFARTGHPQAADPYFLYGASNLGSLIALLGYPVLIEPWIGLSRQAGIWTFGFALLAVLIGLCAAAVMQRLGGASAVAATAAPVAATQTGDAVTWQQRALWIALAFVPSGLLVAFTSHMTTDIASAPFLWVIPLALFLATFILVFRDEPVIPHAVVLRLQPIAVIATFIGISSGGPIMWWVANLGGLAAFLITTLVAHKELYDRRPAPGHLTEFYLWMSAGGVLGGVFAALVAPQLFNTIVEFPLLLVMGLMCRPGCLAGWREDQRLVNDAAVAGCAMLALWVGGRMIDAGWLPGGNAPRVIAFLACAVVMMRAIEEPRRLVLAAAAMAVAMLTLPSAMSGGVAERSFFGVHRVRVTDDGQFRLLSHGTTVHGAQRLKDETGARVTRPVPATYYHPDAPMTFAAEAGRRMAERSGRALSAGVVGLGAGVMACHAKAGEAWRFYEIDPVVVDIARNRDHFEFLATCLPDNQIIVGDARLTLAKEPAATFDMLLIDAFASDAVPVHLLTVEAIRLYLDKLTPNGLLALHVSNRHMDIEHVAAATALAVPGTQVALVESRPKARSLYDATPSRVVFVTRSTATMLQVLERPDARAVTHASVPPWTDDYSDIVTSIWRKMTRR